VRVFEEEQMIAVTESRHAVGEGGRNASLFFLLVNLRGHNERKEKAIDYD
jgi:hypothetical protein